MITIFSSRDVTWCIGAAALAATGAGVMNLRRRTKRKATISMSVLRTIATDAKRMWSSHVDSVREAGDSMIKGRSEEEG